MFGFFRKAATSASLANLGRGLENMVLTAKRGDDLSKLEPVILAILQDAELAIANSRKTSQPINAEGIVELCEALMDRKQIQLGAATEAVLTFYQRLFAGPYGQGVGADLLEATDSELKLIRASRRAS